MLIRAPGAPENTLSGAYGISPPLKALIFIYTINVKYGQEKYIACDGSRRQAGRPPRQDTSGRSSAARSRAAVRAVTRKRRQRPIPFYTISDALPPSVHYSFIRFRSGPFAYAVYDIAYDLFSCPLRALKVKAPFEIFRRKIRIFSHAEERQDT